MGRYRATGDARQYWPDSYQDSKRHRIQCKHAEYDVYYSEDDSKSAARFRILALREQVHGT